MALCCLERKRTSGWLVGIPLSLEPIYQNSDRQVGPFQKRIRHTAQIRFSISKQNIQNHDSVFIKIVSSLHPPLLDALRRFRLPKSLYLVIFCWLVSSPHPFQSHHESKGCELNICNSFSRQTTCILAHQLGPSPRSHCLKELGPFWALAFLENCQLHLCFLEQKAAFTFETKPSFNFHTVAQNL